MFDVGKFCVVFSDSLSNMDKLAVKIYGPRVHHGISAYIIDDINRAKKKKRQANNCLQGGGAKLACHNRGNALNIHIGK
jgi:hypothetical protein